MKIGILTFHFGINFGGVLQCYALQMFLEKHGHIVEIINFIPPGFSYSAWWKGNGYSNAFATGIKKAAVRFRYAKRQRNKFECFRKNYLNLSKAYSLESLSSISDEYEALIVGSDQVWNPSQRSHAAYFLNPFINFQGKRISYAPCCAMKSVDSKDFLTLKNSLLRFNAISARNIETQDFVWSLIGRKPEIVVDPTLLIDFDFDLGVNADFFSGFILTYILGNEIDGGHPAVISRIKNKCGNLPVYAIILSENKPQIFSWANKTYWDIGPAEWLMLMKNAKYIYTDSFHGVLFAIKYKKPFLAYYSEKARASRFIDLSTRYNLKTFIVKSIKDAIEKESFSKSPNYTEIDSMLCMEVQKSHSFLDNALK